MVHSKIGTPSTIKMIGSSIPAYNSIHNKRFHKQLLSGARKIGSLDVDPNDVAEIKSAYSKDPWFSESENVTTLIKINDLYWRNLQLAIPDNEIIKDKILISCHNSLCAGHLGKTKTFDLVHRQFWWPGLRKDVNRHCQSCDSCQRVRVNNQKPGGLLQPLPIPENTVANSDHGPYCTITTNPGREHITCGVC